MAKTKGFKFNRRPDETLTLTFEPGHELHGLEITVHRWVPVGVVVSASAGDIGQAIGLFAEHVTGWNVLDDDGNPVTPSAAAFGQYVGLADVSQILEAWTEALTQPSVPLGRASNDGDTSAEG